MTRVTLAKYFFIYIWSYIIALGMYPLITPSRILVYLTILGFISLSGAYLILILKNVDTGLNPHISLAIGVILLGFLTAIFSLDYPIKNAEEFVASDRTEKIIGIISKSPINRDGFYILNAESGDKILIDSPFNTLKVGYSATLDNNIQLVPPDFFYKNFLQKEGVFLLSIRPRIYSSGDTDQTKFFANIRNTADDIIENSMPYPESRILSAMTLGFNDAPKEIKQNLANAGIIHITSVSGMHVAILAVVIFYLFSVYSTFSPSTATVSTILIIILYIIFINSPPAAIRSGLMISLYFIARLSGRRSAIGRIVIVSIFFMLIENPYLLLNDIGFQLSYMAVLGIIYISPLINNYIKKPQESKFRRLTREAISISLGAQLATTPLVLYNFKLIPILSPIFNILVAPFLTVILVLGIIGVMVGFLWIGFSTIILSPVYLLLKITDVISSYAYSINLSHLDGIAFLTFNIFFQIIIFLIFISQTLFPQKIYSKIKLTRIAL